MAWPARVLIFTRYPAPGQVKTRLIPALGPETAARLQRRMTEHVVAVARSMAEGDNVRIHVAYTGAAVEQFRSWLGHDLHYLPQAGNGLGQRLHGGFQSLCKAGPGPIVVVGSDAPELVRSILAQALHELKSSDMVIGPARDGGYYLIGLHREHPELFAHIHWGCSCVFTQSMDAAGRLGLKVAVLPRLGDVDRPEDLPGLRSDPRFEDIFSNTPRISIVIPCLNEAATLGRTLERIFEEDPTRENIEVIVTDGGSRDNTRPIAARSGALVVQTQAGRAAQQNVGAAHASGRLLLFLHADTLLPRGFAKCIRDALDEPATIAGAFRLHTDSPRPAMRLIELAANIRSSAFQHPYGDQGLFMEKRVFHALGGFAPLPIMEDFEFIRRLRRRGRIVTLDQAVQTSSRRWEQLGIMKTFAVNQAMIAGFLYGLPGKRLARMYRGAEGARP